MYCLSKFVHSPAKDASFAQTQFANTDVPQSLCFVMRKYLKIANENANISAIITTPDLAPEVAPSKGLIVAENPEQKFYQLHNCLAKKHQMRPPLKPGISENAKIHPSAVVDAYCQIGADVEIGPGAVIASGSLLDEGVVVGPNAVVGADGHFFKRFGNDLVSVTHAGGVWLKTGAHILASAVVSKSLHTDFTTIGSQSVVSVKSHVGHGCVIGDRTIIAGSAQISGYTQIGNDGWIGPGVTVGNLLKIGNNVSIEAGSVLVESLSDGARVSGNYAVSHSLNMMEYARKRRKRG